MKKVILLIAALLPLAFSYGNAQLFTPFKASEGKAKAQECANESGIPNMELYMLGTYNGDVPGLQYTVEFDLSNGKATAWVYVFRSTTYQDSLRAYAILKAPLFGLTCFELPISSILGELPLQPDSSLTNRTWFDSDEMSSRLLANEYYIQYKNEAPDLTPQAIGLGINPIPFLGLENEPFWFLTFTSSTIEVECFMHAVSGEMLCESHVSAIQDDEENRGISIYPNPASDFFYVTIKDNTIFGDMNIELFDVSGQCVKSQNGKISEETSGFYVVANDLPAGVYF